MAKRIPGAYDISCFFNSPGQEIRNWREYFSLNKKFGTEYKSDISLKGKLLIVSLQGNSVEASKMEIFFAKAAQFAGLDPVVLTNRWAWSNRYYRAFGIKSFVFFEDFLDKSMRKVDKKAFEHAFGEIKTFEELMKFKFKDVNIGKYICSTLIRQTYSGRIDVSDANTRKLIFDGVIDGAANVIAANEIFDAFMPSSVLFLERGYSPYGEFFNIALNRKLNVVQWIGSHKSSAFTLKRYNLKNSDQHPASLSINTWDKLRNTPWNQEKSDRVKQELFKNYSTGEWFSEVGTHFHSNIASAEQIKKQLGLDLNKKTAAIFPHLFWDATFFWGKDIFENYMEWFVETVKAACNNKNVNWIIKLHPANIVKYNRDGKKGEYIEKTCIKQAIGELPPHIKILEPDTNISTYSLYNVIDYGLTVRGTVGIEASIFGITIFTAGTGRYDKHGFTIDSSSREDFLNKIAKIHTFPRLSKEQIELAQKFAYGTFISRPFEFSSMRIIYNKDKKATPSVNYIVKSIEELKSANDTIRFGNWFINSKDEDYLRL